MVNTLVIAIFLSSFLAQYLVRKEQLLNALFVVTPEILAGIAMLVFIARAVFSQKLSMSGKYVALIGALLVSLLIGVVVQGVAEGPIVEGLRDYLKFLPVFLLPMAYRFSTRERNTQLAVLGLIILAQVPLAFYQRFVQFAHRMHTGDPITGMATTSSALSLLLICAIAMMVALYLQRRIGLVILIALIAVLVAPTTLNETKATLVLLPIAFIMPFFFVKGEGRRLKALLPVAGFMTIALVAFVSSYDYFAQYRQAGGGSIQSFLSDSRYESYLYTGAAEGDDIYIGRVDSMVIALRQLSRSPLDLAFGLGAGNVSSSSIPGFSGQYAGYDSLFGVKTTQITGILWELGVVGLIIVLLLYLAIFRDSIYVARHDPELDLLGRVWPTIVILMTLALPYKSVLYMNEIAYPFWFFSAVIASRAWVLRRQRASRTAARRGDATVVAPGRQFGAAGIGAVRAQALSQE